MSDYDRDYDDRRSHRGSSTRYRDREPEYVSETTYIQRGSGRPSNELVYRGREDSIEDIPRDFPPPNAEYRRTKVREEYPPRRPRSSRYSRDDYDDDYYSDYAPPPPAPASRRSRKSRNDDYYSDGGYDRPPLRERRKSRVEEIAEGVGLGGVLAAVTGKANSSRSKSRRRGGGSSSDRGDYRSRSRGADENRKKWQQAAKAAVVTGVIEAVRSRNEPGPWTGPKGQRIATAALAAGGIDGFLDRDPNKRSKRHIVESVVGGLAANRLANGGRDRSASRGRSMSRSRSRSRGGFLSRSRSRLRSLSRGGRDRSESPVRGGRSRSRGLKDVAALGGIAAAGKAIYDRVRSKSRGRDRRSPSVSSEDSYVPARRPRYRADRGGSPDEGDTARGRSEEAEGEGQLSRKRDGSSDSVSTTDLEQQRKKTRGKELLTAGLATVATIHAAHGVYSSMVASEKRHQLVMEGEMSHEEARKRKSKNMLQDAAAVGIAALGIKSAFSEWKEMNETRHSFHELEAKKRKKRKARENARRERRENGGYGRQAYGYPAAPRPSGPTYADANPYAATLPPPPMGVQEARY
ncbi:hypothetical protein FKW77_003574 [Venturia effusa]|uniref:DUF3824 domain-containing protein n=1 Tax=Venturia effusa TaxID=50376 RepID=A0A517LFC1_9PEZI|nr:hypothetical protein FKW77_003574 [Venturia effusa]